MATAAMARKNDYGYQRDAEVRVGDWRLGRTHAGFWIEVWDGDRNAGAWWLTAKELLDPRIMEEKILACSHQAVLLPSTRVEWMTRLKPLMNALQDRIDKLNEIDLYGAVHEGNI